jgi:hypothetical protein
MGGFGRSRRRPAPWDPPAERSGAGVASVRGPETDPTIPGAGPFPAGAPPARGPAPPPFSPACPPMDHHMNFALSHTAYARRRNLPSSVAERPVADTPEKSSAGGGLGKGGVVLLRRADPTRSPRAGRELGSRRACS